MKAIRLFPSLLVVLVLLVSCKKYQEINEEAYPDQTVYLPAAVEGNSTSGVYFINRVAVPGQIYRYTVDAAAKRLRIPLAVYRSGIDTKGTIEVSLAANTDTAAKMLAAGKLPAGTEVLPSGKYEVVTAVTIADGAGYAPFNFSVDLDFLLANGAKKFAIGVTIGTSGKTVGKNNTAVLLIDPSFLVPAANFTTAVSGRTVTFSNTTVNGITYFWNYGDGSAGSTAPAAAYTYAAAGTYTITLTATGALGASNASVKTATVTVL